MIPHVNVSVVQADEHPRLVWVKIGAFHTIWPRRQFTFYVQPQRLSITRNTDSNNSAINISLCNI